MKVRGWGEQTCAEEEDILIAAAVWVVHGNDTLFIQHHLVYTARHGRGREGEGVNKEV